MQLHLKVRIAKNDNSYTNRIVEPTMTPSNISGVIRNAGEIPSGRKTFQLSAYVDKPISDLSGQHLFSEDNYNGWVAKGIVNPEHTSVLNVYRLNADGTVSDTYSSESWKITVNFLDGFIPEETDILFIAFDEQSEAHPTSASISTGYEFRSREITSALWFIAFSDLGIVGKKVDKIDITFYDWVGGGTPRISYVGMQPTVTFDGSYVQSFSGSETAFEPETEFTPGILEQYADIRLLDHNGYLKVLAEGGALYSNQKIAVYVTDETSQYLLGKYFSNDWSFEDERVISLSCKDPSTAFKNIQAPLFNITSCSVHDLLVSTFAQASQPWEYVDTYTEQYCKNITSDRFWMRSADLEVRFEDICAVAMLSIYWYNDRFYVMRCY